METETSAAPRQNYLDEMAQGLANYRELLNDLQQRLNSVSERRPSEKSSLSDTNQLNGLHVSNLISSLRENNQTLQQIINELVI